MNTKKTKRRKTDNIINEPLPLYHKEDADIGNSITFCSLEEMEQDNYIYWMSLTPEQRLEIVCEMRKRMWKTAKKTKTPFGNRIYFDK